MQGWVDGARLFVRAAAAACRPKSKCAMRLFVGIPLEGQTHQTLAALLPEFRRRLPSCRWVHPENLHLTLRFLGEIPESARPEVQTWFRDGVATPGFWPLELDKTGSFQNRDRIILWCGVRAVAWMTELASRLSAPVAGVSAEARSFTPHLTLGRYRVEASERRRFREFQAYYEALHLPPVQQAVVRIVLYESRLTPSGAVYRELLSLSSSSA